LKLTDVEAVAIAVSGAVWAKIISFNASSMFAHTTREELS